MAPSKGLKVFLLNLASARPLEQIIRKIKDKSSKKLKRKRATQQLQNPMYY
jgi:hypothetical protein